MSAGGLLDQRRRPLRQLRLSVTDRCNLRCDYCMPEEDYAWLPRPKILSLEELAQIAEIFVGAGVRGVRLTGGEPLLRKNLTELIARLASLPALEDLAMTTNAVHLSRHARALRTAGLKRLTLSLDTLRPERFAALTRRDRFDEVLAGIHSASEAGFSGTKMNVVVQRDFNFDELPDLLAFGRDRDIEVRFIEYMDVGGATAWTQGKVVSRAEILAKLKESYGPIEEVPRTDAAPADRYELADGTVFGIIASTTQPFCSTCDRSRVTADGSWFRCLYAREGTSLRDLLREQGPDAVRAAIQVSWAARSDAGAEE
ncbi:MAG: GTP 3',8-cyclase MoaA, partial [Planctomycetes bacterium]|nr:GTP 3',8-cyclase MoaA [Planctomycetota bacterium]